MERGEITSLHCFPFLLYFFQFLNKIVQNIAWKLNKWKFIPSEIDGLVLFIKQVIIIKYILYVSRNFSSSFNRHRFCSSPMLMQKINSNRLRNDEMRSWNRKCIHCSGFAKWGRRRNGFIFDIAAVLSFMANAWNVRRNKVSIKSLGSHRHSVKWQTFICERLCKRLNERR